MKLPFFNFYSFGFDNTLQGLSPERIEIIPGNDFLREIPEKNRGEFSRTASYLDQAGDSLSQSAEFSGIANQYSLSAKNALTNAFGVDILLAGAMPSSWAILEGQKIAAVANYALNYPSEYSDALSLAAGSFDSVNLAGRETAAKVESEFSTLSKAGAGSPAYSGGAKDAYFSAESFLSQRTNNPQLFFLKAPNAWLFPAQLQAIHGILCRKAKLHTLAPCCALF
ncbi:MAG: hypothetical protein NT051_04315 [Candidatus Micrarchaeota archaeon]|nr:hypothetical protein [Candidatus Micrarchaeota archaeon]